MQFNLSKKNVWKPVPLLVFQQIGSITDLINMLSEHLHFREIYFFILFFLFNLYFRRKTHSDQNLFFSKSDLATRSGAHVRCLQNYRKHVVLFLVYEHFFLIC